MLGGFYLGQAYPASPPAGNVTVAVALAAATTPTAVAPRTVAKLRTLSATESSIVAAPRVNSHLLTSAQANASSLSRIANRQRSLTPAQSAVAVASRSAAHRATVAQPSVAIAFRQIGKANTATQSSIVAQAHLQQLARNVAVTQFVSTIASRRVAHTLSLAQANAATATNVRSLLRTVPVSQSSAAVIARTPARSIVVAQSSAATIVCSINKAVAATQTTTTAYSRTLAILRTLTPVQPSSAITIRLASKRFSLVQTSAANQSGVRNYQRAILASQNSIALIGKNVVLSRASGQLSTAIVTTIGMRLRTLAVSQVSTGAALKAPSKTLGLSQASLSLVARTPSRVLGLIQASATTIPRSALRLLSATEIPGATVVGGNALNRVLVVGQTSTAAKAMVIARAQATSQLSMGALARSNSRRLNVVQGAATIATRAITHSCVSTQSATTSVARSSLRNLTAMTLSTPVIAHNPFVTLVYNQGTVVALNKQTTTLRALVVTQTIAATKRITGSRALTMSQISSVVAIRTAARSLGIAQIVSSTQVPGKAFTRTLGILQTVISNRIVTVTSIRGTGQVSAVILGRSDARALNAPQAMGASSSKLVFRALGVTQTETAIGVHGQANSRTFAIAQSSTSALRIASTRALSSGQVSVATTQKIATRFVTVLQGSSLMLPKTAVRIVLDSQTTLAALARSASRIVITTQPQGASIAHTLSSKLSTAQSEIVTATHNLTHPFVAPQTSASLLGKGATRALGMSQMESVAVLRSMARSFIDSTTPTVTVIRGGSPTRLFVVAQASATTLIHSTGSLKILNVSQLATIVASKNVQKRLATTQLSVSACARGLTHQFAVAEPQTVTILRNLIHPLMATQPSAVVPTKQAAHVLGIVQSMPVGMGRTITHIYTLPQPTTTVVQRGFTHGCATTQSMIGSLSHLNSRLLSPVIAMIAGRTAVVLALRSMSVAQPVLATVIRSLPQRVVVSEATWVALQRQATFGRGPTDTLPLVDALTGSRGVVRIETDTTVVSDAVGALPSKQRYFAETYSTGEAVNRFLVETRGLIETNSLIETLSLNGNRTEFIAEAIVLGEMIRALYVHGGHLAFVSENLVTREFVLVAFFGDIFGYLLRVPNTETITNVLNRGLHQEDWARMQLQGNPGDLISRLWDEEFELTSDDRLYKAHA